MRNNILILLFFCFALTGAQMADVSLKEYVDRNIANLKENIEARFDAIQIAVNKAEEAQQLRNEVSNEWRGQSKDREAAFALKTELQSLKTELQAIRADTDKLQLSEATLSGKASQNTVNVTLGISLFSIAVSLFAIFRNK